MRSAFAVGQARGVVLLAAGQRGVPCFDYTPQQVKGAVCGRGRAGKEQVARMVQALLSLPRPPSPTTPPTRSPSPSATPTARRCARGAAVAAVIALVARRASRSAAPTTSWSRPPAASATAWPSPPRRCATSRPSARRVSLHAHLVVRDDALDLYGFATEEERDLFLMLICVQSVGPKVALAVLSGGSPRELVAALAAGDVARLQAVPGIGKRTAERIVVELREKVGVPTALGAPITVTPRRRPAHARARRPARARLHAGRGRRAARRRRGRDGRGPDRQRAAGGARG